MKKVISQYDVSKIENLIRRYADVYKSWSWGRCVFNAYEVLYPDFTRKLRGTELDCSVHNNVQEFMDEFYKEYEVMK